MAINIVIISGNLTKDPELRYTPQGDAVCNFTVAVNEKYTKRSGEEVEEVSFIYVSTFGKFAEICNEQLKKGSGVVVEGKLKQDRWEDKEGKAQSKTQIRAREVKFLIGKPKEITEELPPEA